MNNVMKNENTILMLFAGCFSFLWTMFYTKFERMSGSSFNGFEK
jgi:hypothetical protein